MKDYKGAARTLALVTQLGISMVAPVILCVLLGSWLDDRFGWHTVIPLLLLGIAAGARNCWVLMKQINRELDELDKEAAEELRAKKHTDGQQSPEVKDTEREKQSAQAGTAADGEAPSQKQLSEKEDISPSAEQEEKSRK